MPEWLLEKDSYIPNKKKDTFIDKSILSMLNIFSKLKYNSAKNSDINTTIKTIATFIIVLFISLSRKIEFLYFLGVIILIALSLLKPNYILSIIKGSIAPIIITFVLLIPAFIAINTNTSIIFLLKTALIMLSLNMLIHTSKYNEILDTLKIFFLPDIFIFILDITIKYILILGEYSLNMLYALKIRTIGNNKNKNNTLSAIIGALFIKSKEMSFDMHDAMECRGFTGEYKIKYKHKLVLSDIIFIVINSFIIYMFFYINFFSN